MNFFYPLFWVSAQYIMVYLSYTVFSSKNASEFWRQWVRHHQIHHFPFQVGMKQRMRGLGTTQGASQNSTCD